MDAMEFLVNLGRYCKNKDCKECNLWMECDNIYDGMTQQQAETMIDFIDKWTKKHPIKTRQSEFLKMFPNACLSPRGVIAICPYDIDTSFSCTLRENVETHVLQNPCIKCRCEYWLHDGE